VHGAVGGADWPTRLIDATALGAAAVRAPVAGALDLADRDELRPAVRISTLPGPGAA
jgi:tagatose 6-phosphate kinase